MKRTSLLAAAAVLTACFSPEVSTETAMGSGGTDGSTGTGMASGPAEGSSGTGPLEGSSSEVDPDTTATGSETGIDPNDAPPQFESFTVNGSTTPAEVDEGGTIALEADVTDDMGVASVEFFDGDTSLGVVDAAPFELDVAVSSADSGAHAYSALATDTAGQTAQSEEVSLSINIVGGAIEQLREDLFVGNDTSTIANGGLDVQTDDRVFLAATLATGSSRVLAFNDGLSQLWSQTYAGAVSAGPASVGDVLVIGAVDIDNLNFLYRSLSTADGETIATLTRQTDAGSSLDLAGTGRVFRSGDQVVLSESLQSFAAYEADLSSQVWLANMPAPYNLAASGSAVFASFLAPEGECANGSEQCVRRYDGMGQTEWTTGLPTSSPAFLAPHPDGGTFAVLGAGDEGYEVLRLDATGTISEFGTYGSADVQYVAGAHPDGAGGLVVCGSTGPYATGRAFATRIGASGEEVWDQRQFFSNSVDSAALDVVVNDDAVFVYGLANNDAGFLGFTGDAWVARLSL